MTPMTANLGASRQFDGKPGTALDDERSEPQKARAHQGVAWRARDDPWQQSPERFVMTPTTVSLGASRQLNGNPDTALDDERS
jgi:hypothetical protein